ncbi:MAG: cold shock domain-containing protein [Actinomycetes bacterium]
MLPVDIVRGPSIDGTVDGAVVTFDDSAGYGTVGTLDSSTQWFFHCTAISDGTRLIEVGAPVTFEVVAGRLGRFEAINIKPAL